MEYKIEFHPAALKEFCELDGSKKQTDLFALNGTHSKAKNVNSEQIRLLKKNDKRICSHLTMLTQTRRTLVLSKSVC